jgi:hypothetical protein
MSVHIIRLRALAALIVTLSFGILFVSGFALFIKPPGWWANQSNWTWLGITKTGWDAVHTNLALLFVLAGLAHLYFNWKPLLHHLQIRRTAMFRMRAEPWVAAAVVLAVLAGTVAGWAPFSMSTQLREDIKAYWTGGPVATNSASDADEHDHEGRGVGHRAGFGRMSVEQACEDAGISLVQGLENLAESGVLANPNYRLRWAADDLGTTPRAVYELIVAETSES